VAQIGTQRAAETANIMATVTKQNLPVMDTPAFVRTKSVYCRLKAKSISVQQNTHWKSL